MSLVVRVIAPTGRDAELITTVLRDNQVSAQVADSRTLLQGRDDGDPIGPLLIAEEALYPVFVQQLSQLIHHQPAWSDLPVLVLTGSGREPTQNHRMHKEHLQLGSPILLERPIRTATLVSSVKAALRARIRQYEVRDAVAELKRQRETLQVVLDHLPVGVLLAKPSGEVVLANQRLEMLLQHPPQPISPRQNYGGWPAFEADGSAVEERAHPLTRAMKAAHSLAPEDVLYARGDGTKAWLSLAASPILGERGELTGGVLTVADVDQQRRSEAALIQNEKLAAVGRLAASVSHEINNPLEAVTNLLYLARMNTTLPDDVREYLTGADQELARVSQIVSHTLQFHKQSTRPRAVTAKELLVPTLGLFAGRLANAHITMELDDRSQAKVTCYEGEVRQVLNNLVGNAVDSMRTGGRLVIRARDVRSWRDGMGSVRGVRLTIADTGHGMTDDVRKRVFEPFYTTKGLNGTGLGLWISRGIIDKHHGRVQVRSSAREGASGTVFSLFLPLQGPAE